MLVKQKVKDSKIAVVQFKDFFSINQQELLDLFEEFKVGGVIETDNYDSNVWVVYNEKMRTMIEFHLDELLFQRVKDECDFTYTEVLNAVKGYALYKLQENPINAVKSTINSIIDVIEETNYFDLAKKKVLIKKKIKSDTNYYVQLVHLIEFLEFFSIPQANDYFDTLYYQADNYRKYVGDLKQGLNQRNIGKFESIFEVDFAINEFWKDCTLEEKEEFFPIKLWWAITTIIPLRSFEFVLTPYNCLDKVGNQHYLIVRRTKLKSGVPSQHKIDKDYYLQRIRITEELYSLIEEYRCVVDKYDFEPNFYYEGYEITERRRFLLSHRSYFNFLRFKGGIRRQYILDYMSTGHLSYLLKQFYSCILEDKLNYETVLKDNEKDLLPYQIEYISLMDTRHFAFINMVLNDVEPLLIKQIGGHSTIRSSYHYFNHIESFVKCYTYYMANKLARQNERKNENNKGNSNGEVINVRRTNHKELVYKKVFDDKYEDELSELPIVNDGKGKCTSKQVNFEDCKKVEDSCEICPFYQPTQTKAQQDIKEKVINNEQKVATEVLALKELVTQHKRAKNFNQEFGVKINRIKAIANQNAYMLARYFE